MVKANAHLLDIYVLDLFYLQLNLKSISSQCIYLIRKISARATKHKIVNTKTSKNEPLIENFRKMVKATHIFSTFMYWIFYYLQLNLKSISSKCIPQFTTSNLLSSPFARGEYYTRWKSPRLTRRNNTCMASLKCLQTSTTFPTYMADKLLIENRTIILQLKISKKGAFVVSVKKIK